MAYEIENKVAEQTYPIIVSGTRRILTNNGNTYALVHLKDRANEPQVPNGWEVSTEVLARIQIKLKQGEIYHRVEDELGNVYVNITSYLP